jgi:hypothetical protein
MVRAEPLGGSAGWCFLLVLAMARQVVSQDPTQPAAQCICPGSPANGTIGTCAAPGSLYAGRTGNNTCLCAPGWSGSECRICTSNHGCSLLKDDRAECAQVRLVPASGGAQSASVGKTVSLWDSKQKLLWLLLPRGPSSL